MLIDDPVDTDGIVSVVNTVIMPSLTKPNDEPGIMVHIDDCLCEDCTLERGEILFASTVLIEITNDINNLMRTHHINCCHYFYYFCFLLQG